MYPDPKHDRSSQSEKKIGTVLRGSRALLDLPRPTLSTFSPRYAVTLVHLSAPQTRKRAILKMYKWVCAPRHVMRKSLGRDRRYMTQIGVPPTVTEFLRR